MAIIRTDIYGYYLKNNGSIWRPIWPDKEISEIQARKMYPTLHEQSLDGIAVKTQLIDNHLMITLFDKKNYGTIMEEALQDKSTTAYRDFKAEMKFVNDLVASGSSMKEAYSKLWAKIANR